MLHGAIDLPAYLWYLDCMNAITRAIKIAGGQEALACRLGVSKSLVGHWSTGRRQVPPSRCAAIEAATGVKAEDLCPDVIWQRQGGRITGYVTTVEAA
jgi:DNA-binding transcriptional regulator YdaS (Cro superfamily)